MNGQGLSLVNNIMLFANENFGGLNYFDGLNLTVHLNVNILIGICSSYLDKWPNI